MNNDLNIAGAELLARPDTNSVMASENIFSRIMQDQGTQVGHLLQAIMADDMDAARVTAMTIADHPQPSFMEQMLALSRLSTDATAFKQAAAKVQQAAVVVKLAAEAGDRKALADGFNRLVLKCLACHNRFRNSFGSNNNPDAEEE